MKKIFSILTTGIIASSVLLAGCGSSSDGSSDSGASNGDKITLEVYQGKVEIKSQFEEMVKEYEKENPNIDIKFTAVGGGTDYLGSLKTKFASGDEPEIFSISGPSEAEQFKDYLADLSDTESAKLAFDGTLDAVTEGEQILGLPYNQEGYGLIYNKAMFEEAGIDPTTIKSFDDLQKAVETLDSKKADLGIEAVFALAAKEKWVIGNHLANVYLAPEFNDNVLEAYNAKTVEFQRGDELKRMLDLQVEYSVQPTLNIDYSQQVEQYFSLEQVAMIQQGNWVFPSIEQMDPELAQNIGVLTIPVEGFEGSIPVGVPNYWAVNKNKDEETIQAAKDFLDWMNTSEVGKDTVVSEFNFIPAYEGYDVSKIADPLSKDIYEYSSNGNTVGWVFAGYPSNAWGDILGANMQKYIANEMSWEEVISDSIKKWEEPRN
ncbi:ABC transporter substrate-binding protein [Bacillus sp. PS06]|uniref:ABC transporter substrate-binding protein n=1 Tax=Bacillus sp. PS06 TaxID=2764176 RepID=UPI00177F7A9E|nr:extracellular solute-binding protein [Bacillus sp. PS06]MBD8069611.1 extracellular solute-binding protein [Bacillus sp. PS06]